MMVAARIAAIEQRLDQLTERVSKLELIASPVEEQRNHLEAHKEIEARLNALDEKLKEEPHPKPGEPGYGGAEIDEYPPEQAGPDNSGGEW